MAATRVVCSAAASDSTLATMNSTRVLPRMDGDDMRDANRVQQVTLMAPNNNYQEHKNTTTRVGSSSDRLSRRDCRETKS